MLKIHYGSTGKPISDSELESEFEKLKLKSEMDNSNVVWRSTENIFMRIRLGVKQGDISHDNVKFYWQGKEMPIDENGRLRLYIDGFLNITEKMLLELY